MRRINFAATHIAKDPRSDLPGACRLIRRENSELDAELRHDIEALKIHGGLRKPHTFGLPSKARFEVADAPNYLGVFVLAVCQGKDHVVIGLRHGGAVTRKSLAAFFIGGIDGFIHSLVK